MEIFMLVGRIHPGGAAPHRCQVAADECDTVRAEHLAQLAECRRPVVERYGSIVNCLDRPREQFTIHVATPSASTTIADRGVTIQCSNRRRGVLTHPGPGHGWG